MVSAPLLDRPSDLTIGIVNIAQEVHGLQLGLVNIARNKSSFSVLPITKFHR
jgi:hypothetical protein